MHVKLDFCVSDHMYFFKSNSCSGCCISNYLQNEKVESDGLISVSGESVQSPEIPLPSFGLDGGWGGASLKIGGVAGSLASAQLAIPFLLAQRSRENRDTFAVCPVPPHCLRARGRGDGGASWLVEDRVRRPLRADEPSLVRHRPGGRPGRGPATRRAWAEFHLPFAGGAPAASSSRQQISAARQVLR